MRRVWKILIGVLAVLVVIVGGGIAYILNIDANAYKSDIVEAVKEETGRDLTIGGPIVLDIGGETVFRISDVAFANADWGSRPQMATLDNLEVVVRLIPTLFGTPDITRVRLSGVDVLIERRADGTANTDFKPAGAPAAEPAPSGSGRIDAPEGGPIAIPILRDVLIEDITARVIDEAAGTDNTFRLERLTLAGDSAETPLTLDLNATLDELPVTMTGQLGSPTAMLDAGQQWTVDLVGDLAGVDVSINGGIMEPTAGGGIDLSVSALGEELSELARKLGVDAPKVGKFEVRADIKGDSDDDLAIENIVVDIGEPDFIHITVDGMIASATRAAGFDLNIGVEGTEIGNLSPLADRFAGQTIPDMGPYKITTRVTGGIEDGVAITGLDAAMGDAGLILLSAKGGIADALNGTGVDITVDARSNQIGALSDIVQSYAGQPVPALGPLDLTARLVGDLPMRGPGSGKMAVRDLVFELGTPGTIQVTAEGGVGDAVGASDLDLKVAAKTAEIGNLDSVARQITGQGVPSLGPLDASATVSGSLESGLSVGDIDVALGSEDLIRVTLAGAVADAVNASGLDLEMTAKAREVGNLDTLAKTYTGGQGVPELGPLDLALGVTGGLADQLSVQDLTLDFGRAETLKVTAGGSIADVLKGQGADLTFALASPDLSVLSEAAGTEVPAIGPVDVTGALKAGADEPLTLEPFTAKVGGSDISGSLTADLRGAVPKLVARLSSQHFDTDDVTGGGSRTGSGGGSSGAASGGGTGGGADDGRVIPAEELPLDALAGVEADVHYTAKRLVASGSVFDNFQLGAGLKDGKLIVTQLDANVGAGQMSGTLSLDASRRPALFDLQFTGDKMGLDALGGAAGLAGKIEGPIDVEIKLTGTGNSPRAIAGSLDGIVNAVVVDSRVRRKAVEEALGENMTQLADLLFGSQGEWVVVNCAVLDYTATDGVLDAKAGFVDTDVSTVTSDGEIDLKTEEISMGVKPQTGVFSVPLLVTGTLANPSVIPDPGKALLSVGGALLTGGGLTAALAVLSATLPENHPCMTTAQAAKEEAAAQEDGSAGGQKRPEDALKDAAKEGLKKLFGN